MTMYTASSITAHQNESHGNTPCNSKARMPSKTCAGGIANAIACNGGGSTLIG